MATAAAQERRPRLMIREMVLENFKSYAGEQRVGPFHKCFSSVVGPNGSGKSNVIDAMLFVFGKRAKQLRLNKVSELIHNSTNHKNLEQARVSVFFQEIVDLDDERFEVVPGSDFSVTRTAQRTNKSDYYIGDRKSNFTEVTDLLKGKGIDLNNNRFLILQGEVEQISMMKPKGATEHETGLLEYLEDIVGTDKYVPALEEGAKALEELNDRRAGAVQRVKAAERERDALEGDKAAAEAWLAKEREALGAKHTLAHLHARDAQRNIAKIEGNLEALESKLQHEKTKLADFTVALKEHEGRFTAVSDEYKTIEAELARASEEFKEYERKDIKYREDLKHLKQKLKKLEDKATKDESGAAKSEAEAERLRAEAPQLAQRAAKLAADVAAAEADVERLIEGCKAEVEKLRKQLQKVHGDLAPWEAQMAEVQARIGVASAERDLLRGQADKARSALADAERAQADAESTAAARKAQIKDLQAEAKQCKSAAEKARRTEADAGRRAEGAEASLREVRGRAEQRRADAGAAANQGAVLRTLMEAKASGAIKGIYGRLGDLGAVDAAYDVAASTACPALDYIVVDGTAAAQRCVELLRSRQAGVATFLILERQAHLEAAMKAPAKPPEGVPRLFDLVKCRDERLRLAFYYAARDTLVAKDLDQASRIAYGADRRWRRVVTLQGEMINEAGTMSGGGGKPRGGRILLGAAAPRVKPADSAAAGADLAAAERDLSAALTALKEARAEQEEAARDARRAEDRLAQLETAIPKATMEVDSALALAADLQSRLGDLQAATKVSKEDAARVKALEEAVAKDEAELAKLRSKSQSLTERAAELEAAMEGAGGEPLRAARARVAKLQKECDACEKEVAHVGVAAAAAERAATKLTADASKARRDAAAASEAQATAMAAFKQLEEAAFACLQAVQETQGAEKAKEAELATIRKDFERRQKEVNVIRQVEVDIGAELDAQRSALKEECSLAKRWATRANELAKDIEQKDSAAPSEPREEELAEADAKELQYRITVLEEEMARCGVDLGAVEAWRAKDVELAARCVDLEAATGERDAVRRTHEELRKRRLDEFMAGFNTISLRLKEMYQMITLGGDAELELVDSLDPFSEGILFSVRPPKKSWKNIANLSGGEKTLSSLSLVFALHHYRPTPLYVMDEIDAALDFKNVSIVGHYIKERTKDAQFVIISLRNNMFELADRLVGIYKTDNATKSVAINPGDFVVGAPQCAPATAGDADCGQEQRAPAVAAV